MLSGRLALVRTVFGTIMGERVGPVGVGVRKVAMVVVMVMAVVLMRLFHWWSGSIPVLNVVFGSEPRYDFYWR